MPDAQGTTGGTVTAEGGGGTAGGETVVVSHAALDAFITRIEPIPGSLRSDRALRAVAPQAGGTPEGDVLEGRTSPGGDITLACITAVEDLRSDLTSLLADLSATRTTYRESQDRIVVSAQQLVDDCTNARSDVTA